jgi:hypothetical protein
MLHFNLLLVVGLLESLARELLLLGTACVAWNSNDTFLFTILVELEHF